MLTDETAMPDKNVHKAEDDYIVASAKARPQPGRLARRPGYGDLGKKIVLRANFFPLEFKPGIEFHSYRLKLDPNNAKKGQVKFIIESMMRKYRAFEGIGVATDGASEIVTTRSLPEDRRPYTCTMGSAGGTGSGGSSSIYTGPWEVTLTLDSSFSPHRMLDRLRDNTHGEELPEEAHCLRQLNILMSAFPFERSDISIIGRGRNKFFRMGPGKQARDMKGGIEAVRGYYSSVRLGASRIMLNLNVSHGAFYQPGPLVDLITAFVGVFGKDRDLLNRYLKGVKVYATHLEKRENGSGKLEYPVKSILGVATPMDGRGKNSPYKDHPPKVKDVASSAANVKFWYEKDGRSGYIPVSEYFAKSMIAGFPLVLYIQFADKEQQTTISRSNIKITYQL
jgi:eukaryotic translation initiation factor 2C